MDVGDFKRAGEPCPLMAPTGDAGWCTVHGTDDQPDGCQSFSCGWRQGAYGDLDRPDMTGIVLVSGNVWEADDQGPIPVVGYMEAWPGAADQPKGQRMVDLVCRQAVAILMRPDGHREFASRNHAWVDRIKAWTLDKMKDQLEAAMEQGRPDAG